MNAPCKDCPDRDYPHCHMVCPKYLDYKAYRERIRADRLAEGQARWMNETQLKCARKKLNKYKREH